MTVLTITVQGTHSDLEFLRVRMVAAVEGVAEEYEANLDGEVEVGWEYDG